MKQVLLVGVAGPNLGDTAIAQVLADGFSSRGHKVTVVHPSGAISPVEGHRNVSLNRQSSSSLWRFCRLIANSEIILIGGGSLIQDKLGCTAVRGMLPFVAQVAFLCRALGRPAILCCVGIDKLHSRFGKLLARLIMRWLVAGIIVRDTSSLRRGRVLAKTTDIAVNTDPAMALRLPAEIAPSYRLGLIPSRHDNPQPTVLSALIAIAGVSNSRDDPLAVILSDTSPAELELGQALREELSSAGYVSKLIVPSSVPELLSALGSCHRLASMRLHPAILAYADRPSLLVSANSKMKSLSRELGLPRVSPTDDQFELRVRQALKLPLPTAQHLRSKADAAKSNDRLIEGILTWKQE